MHRTWDAIWETDDQDKTDNHDDHFLAVDKLPPESITQEAEGELTDDVSNICCCIDSASEEKRDGRGFGGGFFKATEVSAIAGLV